MNLKSLSDKMFLESFSSAVSAERIVTAEIIEYVKEMDRRKLYLEIGFTSLFQFMTEHLGYTPGSAQRRIDSARMLRDVPELKDKLESGEINLMQVATLARAVREKEKTTTVTAAQKRDILATIESLDVVKSEQQIAQMLDVSIKTKEIKRFQKDESVRIEATFSKAQVELLDQVKSLISHTHLNPSFSEVFEFLAKKFVQKKIGKGNARSTATVAVPGCEWSANGKICGSKFQVQKDHIQPRWAGGDSNPENLQWLCGVHNRLRYKKQANIKNNLK